MKKKIWISLAFFFLFLVNSAESCAQNCFGLGDQVDKLGNQTARVIAFWIVLPFRVFDPNDLQGQQGYGIKKFVSVKDKLGYTISFQNDGQFADAPVQNVIVYLPIPDSLKLDINSLKLGNFGFGRYDFQVPPNVSSYTTRLDLRDSLNIYVDVTAGIDINNKQLFWFFKSIDPITDTTPNDARGFLPVSDTGAAKLTDSSGKGQGYVNFYITPKQTALTGDTIPTQASIIFDNNAAIPTNVWDNTIDAFAPTSHVTKADTSQNSITVHWTGKDDPGGSGVRDYELYASENSEPFTLYKSNITDTFTTYTGTPGSSYCFFTLATDNTGNKEVFKDSCETNITLSGEVLPVKWLYFTGTQQVNDALLNWATTSEINTKDFIVERSFNGKDFTDIGTVESKGNNAQVNNYQYVDINAMLLKTTMLYYRLRQVDNDGRFIYSSIVALPVATNVQQPAITASPNPFGQQITLRIITVTASDKTNWVRLTSIDGKVVYQRELNYTGNSTILLQGLQQLANGVYILNVSVNKKLYTIKIIKEN